LPERVCAVCQEQFWSIRGKKTCSDACRDLKKNRWRYSLKSIRKSIVVGDRVVFWKKNRRCVGVVEEITENRQYLYIVVEDKKYRVGMKTVTAKAGRPPS